MTVYILKNRVNDRERVIRVYKKSSYQYAYNYIADMAEEGGERPRAGINNVALQWNDKARGILWTLERWETE